MLCPKFVCTQKRSKWKSYSFALPSFFAPCSNGYLNVNDATAFSLRPTRAVFYFIKATLLFRKWYHDIMVSQSKTNKKADTISVLSLTENTQRYKSLAGTIYALRGVRGFISYRIGAKRQYIARAKRVYRVCLQTYRQAKKRDNISATNRFVISFCCIGVWA